MAEHKVTFVLTGPRKGFTGVLGGRYGFKDGELTCDEHMKDKLMLVLCTKYCCNVKNAPPLWKTVNGASVKVTEMDIEQDPVTTVSEPPKAEVKVEATPKVESKKDD